MGFFDIPQIFLYLCSPIGMWRSWLAHLVWDQVVPRSSRGIPTKPAALPAFFLYSQGIAIKR